MTEEELLKKWLNNNLTDAEKKAFSEQKDYAENLEILNKAQQFKASNFSKAEDFESFKNHYQNKSKNRLDWIKPLLKIASIFIIAFGVYFTFFNSDVVEVKTLLAEKTTVNLPDLSKVTLNADSEIIYDADTWESDRNLNLKGEAYFKVAKGKIFNVITEYGTVTVVGTEFNVKSRSNYFEVICFEGIVKVTSDTITKQLIAGEIFRVLDKKFSEDKTINTEPQWTRNRSSFKTIPLSEVFAELERQYKVKVAFKNTDVSRLFTGVFVNDNIKNALISITKPMNLTFEISSPNQVLIHGNTN